MPSYGAIIVAVLFGVFIFAATVRAWHLHTANVAFRHLRGRVFHDAKQVKERFQAPEQGLSLGAIILPHKLAYGHLAVVGATGSGKTILHRLLMQSVLPRIGRGLGQRALIYDAKHDLPALLYGMAIKAKLFLLNPLDARSAAWDMASDINSPAAALQAATLLIPKAANDSNPFFSNAARHLLHGVLIALILKAPNRWNLRHVIHILRSESLLKQVLSGTEATGHLLQYFEHAATFQNILSTILTRMAPFEIVAAMWDRTETKISLHKFMETESILVLGNAEDNRAAIDTINQILFKRLSELILAEEELAPASSRTNWIFLDEVRQAGRLDGLSALMTKGRSKGAAVVLGLQDISGLRDAYGREVADEIIGQCNTKAILRLNSPETAAWASRVVGTSEFVETRRSQNQSRSFQEVGLQTSGSSGISTSKCITKRELVLDSEFLDFPETSFDSGLTAVFVCPTTGVFRDHLAGSWLKQNLKPPDHDISNFIPRPTSHQYLRPWSDRDATELRLSSFEPIPATHLSEHYAQAV